MLSQNVSSRVSSEMPSLTTIHMIGFSWCNEAVMIDEERYPPKLLNSEPRVVVVLVHKQLPIAELFRIRGVAQSNACLENTGLFTSKERRCILAETLQSY